MLRREFGLCVCTPPQVAKVTDVFIADSTQKLLHVSGTKAEASIQVVESEMDTKAGLAVAVHVCLKRQQDFF